MLKVPRFARIWPTAGQVLSQVKIPISLAVMLKVRYWDTFKSFKLFQFNSELQVLVTSKGIINEGLHQQIPLYIIYILMLVVLYH
jgi:hypothetical protein